MNNALLLVAHGSRRAQSNDEIRTLTRALARQSHASFDAVDCAFLELAEPSIPDALDRLGARGARHVVVLPYFLADGRHVHEDIPAEVAMGERANPRLTVEIVPYVGTAEAMPELLLAIAHRSASPAVP